jgi:hypothetical protein
VCKAADDSVGVLAAMSDSLSQLHRSCYVTSQLSGRLAVNQDATSDNLLGQLEEILGANPIA